MPACRVLRPQRNGIVAAFLVGALFAPPGRAQPVDAADGVTFNERFFIDGQLAPTFTRPDVIDLFATLTPSRSLAEAGTSVEVNREQAPRTLGQLIFAEPRGPAKVLKDLLNTPVKELLVSRAEAGPDVPSPVDDAVESPARTDAPPPTVPARIPDPVSERPPAEIVATTVPGTGVSQAPEPLSAQATPTQDGLGLQQTEPDGPMDVSAGPPPTSDIPTSTRAAGVEQISAAPKEEKRSQPAARLERNALESRELREQRPAASATVRKGRQIATGRATWYEHPGRTASGERFDPNQLTAAHHSLPLGTRVRVRNEKTGRSVIVRINDRIPARTRILIDLSRGSAKAIGLAGTGRVSVHRLDVSAKQSAGSGSTSSIGHSSQASAARQINAWKALRFVER